MESKYNIENFERYLREKTDEFRMYPSKRVWYSIYNNMHPGNRLPSVSMCIVLLCSLLLAGYLNTDTSKDLAAHSKTVNYQTRVVDGRTVASTKLFSDQPVQPADFSVRGSSATLENSAPMTLSAGAYRKTATGSNAPSSAQEITAPSKPALKLLSGSGNSDEQQNHSSLNRSTTRVNTNSKNVFVRIAAPDVIAAKPPVEEMAKNTPGEIPGFVDGVAATGVSNNAVEFTNATGSYAEEPENKVLSLNAPATANASEPAVPAAVSNLSVVDAKNDNIHTAHPSKDNSPAVAVNKNAALSETDKAWIENFAQYNKPAPRKWKGKTSWQAYMTPSLVYRKLHNNTADKEISGNGNGNFNSADIDNVVVQKPSFGIETGLSLQYDLLRVVKIKAGLQLNYTRYNAHAFENHHPISTSLTMNTDNGGAYEVFRATAYSNTYGLNPVKLHNETYQVSIPFGADLRLFSSNKISWYAGATLQPTWVVFGNSYLVSSDRRNYIKDNSMLNRFNMNAAFETYVSFKTATYTWQIGPQYRSQLFSTNSKTYSVEERLVNFGLKIGVTKKL